MKVSRKGPFSEILTNLFSYAFKSKLLTLDIAENLIESTNELLGIKNHIGAAIYNINPDFEKRSISYAVGYDFCMREYTPIYRNKTNCQSR